VRMRDEFFDLEFRAASPRQQAGARQFPFEP
jgi:hypothetical protein